MKAFIFKTLLFALLGLMAFVPVSRITDHQLNEIVMCNVLNNTDHCDFARSLAAAQNIADSKRASTEVVRAVRLKLEQESRKVAQVQRETYQPVDEWAR